MVFFNVKLIKVMIKEVIKDILSSLNASKTEMNLIPAKFLTEGEEFLVFLRGMIKPLIKHVSTVH